MDQDKLLRSVVRIHSYGRPIDMAKPFITSDRSKGVGTGFFVHREDGQNMYVLTCAHVVDGADSVTILLPLLGGTEHPATVLSFVPQYDIAVLVTKKLPQTSTLPIGASTTLKLGQPLTAVGYPLGQTAIKVSDGVYAGFQAALQHTVSISPGNSGGPLISADGSVVGVNSSGVMEASNVGYAVPIEMFMDIRSRMFIPDPEGGPNPGRVVHLPIFGVEYMPITKFHSNAVGASKCGGGGVQITSVIPDSGMHDVGVVPGDILTQFDGMAVDTNGEVSVPWNYQKVSLGDVFRRSVGEREYKLRIWQAAARSCADLAVRPRPNPHAAMRDIFPPHDPIPYMVVAGLVIMPLLKNHETCPQLSRMYACKETSELTEPSLVISHIFNGTLAQIEGGMYAGDEVGRVNEVDVHTLDDVRRALVKCKHVDGYTMLSIATPKGKMLVLNTLDVLQSEQRALSDKLYTPEPELMRYLSAGR